MATSYLTPCILAATRGCYQGEVSGGGGVFSYIKSHTWGKHGQSSSGRTRAVLCVAPLAALSMSVVNPLLESCFCIPGRLPHTCDGTEVSTSVVQTGLRTWCGWKNIFEGWQQLPSLLPVLMCCDGKEKRQLGDREIQQTKVWNSGTADWRGFKQPQEGPLVPKRGGKSFNHRGPNMAHGDSNQKTGTSKKRDISVTLLWFRSR